MDYNLKEFRFLTVEDRFDRSILNWSRTYEWAYAIAAIEHDPDIVTVHNTCCGYAEIHKQFHDKLINIPNKKIYNSDIRATGINVDFANYHFYNILDEHPQTFDCVLCISTIEDFTRKDLAVHAINNLIKQTKKRLIITADFPGFQPDWLTEIFPDAKIKPTHVTLLNGLTSICPQHDLGYLNIILVDITNESRNRE